MWCGTTSSTDSDLLLYSQNDPDLTSAYEYVTFTDVIKGVESAVHPLNHHAFSASIMSQPGDTTLPPCKWHFCSRNSSTQESMPSRWCNTLIGHANKRRTTARFFFERRWGSCAPRSPSVKRVRSTQAFVAGHWWNWPRVIPLWLPPLRKYTHFVAFQYSLISSRCLRPSAAWGTRGVGVGRDRREKLKQRCMLTEE